MVKKSIANQNIFQEIDFIPMDKDNLRSTYQSLRTKLTAKIQFPSKVLLPDVKGIKEAYIGYIKVKEYLKLIQDDSENLRKSIFYDNIRDYQGENDVNISIAETLNSSNADRLSVLNNGVTIITSDISTVRQDVIINDYQVVNGCQTSYVIYFQKEKLKDDVYLPIKIVSTEDEKIINDIIIANNSQTEVKKEELIALNKIHKKLEAYFETYSKKNQKLYYERRSKQFGQTTNVEKVRIVTISNQLRAVSGMFLDVPHMSSRFYGRLFKDFSSRAFKEDNEMIIYYTSAYSLYKLEFFFRNKSIDIKYRKYKYHILMLLRYHLAGEELPRLNSKKNIELYCNKINEVMWNNSSALKSINYVINIIDGTVDDIMSNELSSKKYIVDNLKNNIIKEQS